MEIDDSKTDGSEKKPPEGEKNTTPTKVPIATAEVKNTSSNMTSSSPSVSEPVSDPVSMPEPVERTPSVEKADSVEPSIPNDSAGTTTTLTNSTPTTADKSDGTETAALLLKEASVVIVATASVASKEDESNEGKVTPKEASTSSATDSTTVNSTKTAIKLKHTSPTGPITGLPKRKIVPGANPKVEKTPTYKSATKNNFAASKTATKTKSLKKEARKKRKTTGPEDVEEKEKEKGGIVPKKKKPKGKKEKEDTEKFCAKGEKSKKARKQTKKAAIGSGNSGDISNTENLNAPPGLSDAQIAVQEQMRKALEEDQYSANGSIVDTDSDDDEHQYMYKGQSIRLDRSYLLQAAKRCAWLEDVTNTMLDIASTEKSSTTSIGGDTDDQDVGEEEGILNEDGSTDNARNGNKKKSSKNKKKGRNPYTNRNYNSNNCNDNNSTKNLFRVDGNPKCTPMEIDKPKNLGASTSSSKGMEMERDQGSIFGQTTGSSNSTWVECDKCKKWRRLRGVVDHSKLPKKWYCSMNRNDPERARCSAPEEEYDAPHTAESAADARTRRHLRVWVRRLQCNEQYESRLPTLTRGKKRSVASSSKEPNEWVRCCNPSCGKWRAVLKIMDAKQNVIDRTTDGEWYCVMNTWDEKTASCAAPQENLPAIGCPSWVLQDEN